MPLKKDILHPTPLSKIRAKLSATCMSFGGHDFYNAFALFDDDHSGDLSCQEFINAIRRNLKMSGATMPNKDIKAVFKSLDTDGTGSLTVDEIVRFVLPKVTDQELEDMKNPGDMKSKNASASSQHLKKMAFNQKVDLLRKIHPLLKAASYTFGGQDWTGLFARHDSDGSGEIGFDEWRHAVRKDLKIAPATINDFELQRCFNFVDKDGKGSISAAELMKFVEKGPPEKKSLKSSKSTSQLNALGAARCETLYNQASTIRGAREDLYENKWREGSIGAEQFTFQPETGTLPDESKSPKKSRAERFEEMYQEGRRVTMKLEALGKNWQGATPQSQECTFAPNGNRDAAITAKDIERLHDDGKKRAERLAKDKLESDAAQLLAIAAPGMDKPFVPALGKVARVQAKTLRRVQSESKVPKGVFLVATSGSQFSPDERASARHEAIAPPIGGTSFQ